MLVVKLTAVLKARSGTDRAESLRVERQPLLQSQDRVSEQTTHQAEEQHGERILRPIVLLPGIDPYRAVGATLQWPQHRIEPCSAVGIEHLQQVKSHRLRDERERHDIHGKLNPA